MAIETKCDCCNASVNLMGQKVFCPICAPKTEVTCNNCKTDINIQSGETSYTYRRQFGYYYCYDCSFEIVRQELLAECKLEITKMDLNETIRIVHSAAIGQTKILLKEALEETALGMADLRDTLSKTFDAVGHAIELIRKQCDRSTVTIKPFEDIPSVVEALREETLAPLLEEPTDRPETVEALTLDLSGMTEETAPAKYLTSDQYQKLSWPEQAKYRFDRQQLVFVLK